MNKRHGVVITFLFVALALNANAVAAGVPEEQDSLTQKVDKLFEEWDKWDSPGAALAVIKDGEVIYKRGYGSAQLEYNIPITPSTVFHVASVSKQFTALAINMLAEQGKLSLDDDIRKHLPEVPDFGKKITIRHLIHHISGLRDQWELLAMAGWRLDDVITKDHIMKMVRHQKDLNFEPGSEYLYCNTGYTLMAEIVERVSGKSFRKWTEENIFRPLGMSNTHFHDDHQMVVANRAYSYYWDEETSVFKKSVLSYANVGATSLFTTAEDLARWVRNFEEKRVGGPAVIERMVQKGVLNTGKEIDYAHGLGVGPWRGVKIVAHSGGDAGFRSRVIMFPDQRFAVVILSNLASFRTSAMGYKVAEIYLADQLEPEKVKKESEEKKTVEVDAKIFDDFVGKYQLDVGAVFVVTKENEMLMVEIPGEGKVRMFPQSETSYFIKEVDAEITFERDDKGAVASAKVVISGREMKAKRLPDLVLTVEQLKEYEGSYYSEELGTTYTFVIEDEKLVATHRRHEDVALTVSETDKFAGDKWWFMSVKFKRDRNKQVTGFNLSGGRVKNMRFSKIGGAK